MIIVPDELRLLVPGSCPEASLSTSEAAARLGTSLSLILDLARTGLILAYREAGPRNYRLSERYVTFLADRNGSFRLDRDFAMLACLAWWVREGSREHKRAAEDLLTKGLADGWLATTQTLLHEMGLPDSTRTSHWRKRGFLRFIMISSRARYLVSDIRKFRDGRQQMAVAGRII